MNKKLFVLLPAVLLLAACGGNTTSTTSGSTGGTETTDTGSTGSTTGTTTTSEEEPSIYGTAEAPITVAEYLAVVGTVTEAVNGTYSPEPFYIKGIADSNSALGSTWANIFLKDALTDTKSCKVQKALNGTGVTATEIGKNDTIVVKGYGEYYNGSYALYGGADGYENPSILSITRG